MSVTSICTQNSSCTRGFLKVHIARVSISRFSYIFISIYRVDESHQLLATNPLQDKLSPIVYVAVLAAKKTSLAMKIILERENGRKLKY